MGFLCLIKDIREFLSPEEGDSRYVVVSVDPAGGGFQSQEAFVVWLVNNRRFALFSGRTIRGHKRGYSFATIPLIFIVSLLETIKNTQDALRALHQTLFSSRTAFQTGLHFCVAPHHECPR